MDIKRPLLIAALAIVSYTLVFQWNKDYGQADLPTAKTQTSVLPGDTPNVPTDVPADAKAAAPVDNSAAQPSTALIKVRTDVLDLAIDPRGGDIVQLGLVQYPRRQDHPDVPFMLFDNGNGGFVNRYGAMGEQWQTQPVYTRTRWCGTGDTQCAPVEASSFPGCDFDPALDTCFYPCPPTLGQATDTCAAAASPTTKYDGTPLFFPLDDQPKTEPWIDAKVPPQYGYPWPNEDTVVPVYGAPHVALAAAHNFHFTSQVTYWFKYDAAATARLDFTGDDDVWVFVNGTLAVDLGGVHQPVDGSVSISAATAAKYGLSDGKVYRINVFHAERKAESSSFRLTLGGFDTARSDCTPICGDGIVSLGEQCDDGVNDGGYGECEANCVIGAFCGDGMKQEGEACDDGNRVSNDGCSATCKIEKVK